MLQWMGTFKIINVFKTVSSVLSFNKYLLNTNLHELEISGFCREKKGLQFVK